MVTPSLLPGQPFPTMTHSIAPAHCLIGEEPGNLVAGMPSIHPLSVIGSRDGAGHPGTGMASGSSVTLDISSSSILLTTFGGNTAMGLNGPEERNYEVGRWVAYDRQFRREALNWSITEPCLYNEAGHTLSLVVISVSRTTTLVKTVPATLPPASLGW